jgi:nicotinamide mononucleotide transporter
METPALQWPLVLDAQQIWFSIGSYPMSYVEFLGTVLSLCSVWLAGRGKILNWPLGILGSVFFAALFYQLRLYADCLEQVYYLGASFYGWILWIKHGVHKNPLKPTFSSPGEQSLGLSITLGLSIVCSWILTQLHTWLPVLFPAPASLPYADGLTTVASFYAMILMAKGRTECWVYWIVINIISVVLYVVKGVYFVSGLYGIYLILGIIGLRRWQALKIQTQTE